tara:strand:- start:601 stop:1011 length:411 start_codon:yes stop_codon:yes gene_type:complete
MSKAIDAGQVAANEKCDLFAQIEQQININKILSNDNIEISFEKNLILNKPEAVLVKVSDDLISIRAQVRTNPISGVVINDQPIVVSTWKDDSFNLQEGCETPSDEEVVSRAFNSVDEAVGYFLTNIEKSSVNAAIG